MPGTAIVTCSCGVKLRLNDPASARRFRCPRCDTLIDPASSATASGSDLASVNTTAIPTGQSCPICQTDIAQADSVTECPECGQVHHRECWTEVGGCSTYGCAQAPAPTKPQEAEAPLAAWGDTKKCPACGETIKAIALRCRYCKTDFHTVEALSVKDLTRRVHREEASRSLRSSTVAFFVVCLFGCAAPITLIVGLGYFVPKKKELARAGPIYQILAYSGTGLSALYLVLGVLFVVFGGFGS